MSLPTSWVVKQVSLPDLAPEPDQRIAIGGGLDSFGDAACAGRAREFDDALADAGVHRVGRAVLHIAAVELQLGEWQLLQPRERRVAGAEVVDRQCDVVDPELHRRLADGVELLHGFVFGDLENEARPFGVSRVIVPHQDSELRVDQRLTGAFTAKRRLRPR